ncbi:TetR/AcrR family transcriptional regulator [Williamsia sterculiae]|uniref:Transcriptional regulator, TetR family n=1 Tax=Williamsia sterculiae TaxID=1344003 RepID=A0A1N7GQ19_9NOCA|nr:TetR/AcrR family transcriptional regulator [Williamsia sterculiae]SIS14673.1 transcriptional regulator, TetR family [Williamsia sterculiae]
MSTTAEVNTRKARTSASPADQQDAILDAAAAEFTEVGVRRASMDDVARRAGVSRSTLYRRFPNKEALLVGVAERLYREGMVRLDQATIGHTPRDAVAEAFSEGARMIVDDPLMRRLVLTDAEIKGITASVTTMFIDSATDRIVRTLRRAGAVRPDPELREAVEIHVRLVLSFLEIPSTEPGRNDPERVRQYALMHLAPMVW